MTRGAALRHPLAVLATVALVVSGCASVTDGVGSAGSTAVPSPSVAPSAATPSTSTSTSVTVTPPPLPSSSGGSTAAVSGCAGADYCDDFSAASSGWPVDNKPHYYANYNKYLGGTYRMGERTARAKTQLAPIDITTITKNYGVQVDVDAVLGQSAPTGSYLGVVCWDHTTADGTEAGFLFFVTATSVDVTLLSDAGGNPHTLARNTGSTFVQPFPATNHLTATCQQGQAGGGTQAELALDINGQSVLRTTYAKSVKNYAWSPAAKVGLLVAGKGADVFWDNFAITAT